MTVINAIVAPFLTFMRQLAMKNGGAVWPGLSTKTAGPSRTIHQPVLKPQAVSINRNSAALNFRPVRMVRVVEAGQSRSNAGRMVISGRMADVCAELDRMVARESASCNGHALPC